MRSPVALHSCRPVSHIAPAACGTDLSRSGFVLQPTFLRDVAGCASLRVPLRRAGERAEYNAASSLSSPQAFPRSLYRRTDVDRRSLDDGQPRMPASTPKASRHAGVLRLRLATAGFHGRLRVGCAWFLFFPRSVGFGPTASSASGAFTIVPSMLCHAHAMPSNSSYSAKPRRHMFTNTPSRFHSRKYWCTELALPYSLGNAFHWQPVRRTYTIAANTPRGSMGFRPPPGRLLYLRPVARLCFGMSGATRSHRASDTVHDLSVLMCHSIPTSLLRSNNYLRISSKSQMVSISGSPSFSLYVRPSRDNSSLINRLSAGLSPATISWVSTPVVGYPASFDVPQPKRKPLS